MESVFSKVIKNKSMKLAIMRNQKIHIMLVIFSIKSYTVRRGGAFKHASENIAQLLMENLYSKSKGYLQQDENVYLYFI